MSGLEHVSTHDLISEAEARGFFVVLSDVTMAVDSLGKLMTAQADINTGFQASFDLVNETLNAAMDRLTALEEP